MFATLVGQISEALRGYVRGLSARVTKREPKDDASSSGLLFPLVGFVSTATGAATQLTDVAERFSRLVGQPRIAPWIDVSFVLVALVTTVHVGLATSVSRAILTDGEEITETNFQFGKKQRLFAKVLAAFVILTGLLFLHAELIAPRLLPDPMEGRIQCARTGIPLADATVYLANRNGTATTNVFSTDSEGRFYLRMVVPGDTSSRQVVMTLEGKSTSFELKDITRSSGQLLLEKECP